VADSPNLLRALVTYMARRVAGPDADDLAVEVGAWIEQNLPSDYPWPGNYRELEQCVKNVLIRRDYRPSAPRVASPIDEFVRDFRAGSVTAEQLLSRYCTLVYNQTGSYEETARRLVLDRRTVKSKVDVELLARLERRQSK
jgi:transcriptional regulator with GAF, ATPase, and Fis domain